METFLSFTQMKYEPSNEHLDYFFFKKDMQQICLHYMR